MLRYIKIALFFTFFAFSAQAQSDSLTLQTDTLFTNKGDTLEIDKDTAEIVQEETLEFEKIDAPTFIATMDSTLIEFYREYEHMETDRDILNVFSFEKNEVPEVSDAVYKKRLADLDAMTPFEFQWNEDVAAVIKMFTKRRRRFTAVTLARSALFFPMYEEKLDQYDMPIELKHLSVIESGLRPTAKSRAGALGLWQFMYRTGKMMGLESNSYVDMRMDPLMATDAACRYLSYLYKMYDDWSMALAAYNAGPGNVNKAIRRSGGKMTYWEIRPYLPKETQNYVPFFIAMTYIMTYHTEHNIYPADVEWQRYEVDTVCPNGSMRMSHIDSVLSSVSLEDLQYLNPIFKTDIIPHTDDKNYCITLPVDQVGTFIEMQDSLINWFNKEVEEDSTIIVTEEQYHYVRSGENLGVIAQKYRTSVRSIMNWNNMSSTRIYPGQKLVVKLKVEKPVEKEKNDAKENKKDQSRNLIDGKFYKIQKGDSLWLVSNKFGTTVDDLKQLNPAVNPSNLKAGEQIRIK